MKLFNKKTFFIILLISIPLAYFTWIGLSLAPGTFVYAERYIVNTNDTDLINRIKVFREVNPEYNFPAYAHMPEGKRDKLYDIYFYYKKENQIIKVWLAPFEANKTTLAFVAVNDGLTPGNWRTINKDFSSSENEEQKKKFEEGILNKLGVGYSK